MSITLLLLTTTNISAYHSQPQYHHPPQYDQYATNNNNYYQNHQYNQPQQNQYHDHQSPQHHHYHQPAEEIYNNNINNNYRNRDNAQYNHYQQQHNKPNNNPHQQHEQYINDLQATISNSIKQAQVPYSQSQQQHTIPPIITNNLNHDEFSFIPLLIVLLISFTLLTLLGYGIYLFTTFKPLFIKLLQYTKLPSVENSTYAIGANPNQPHADRLLHHIYIHATTLEQCNMKILLFIEKCLICVTTRLHWPSDEQTIFCMQKRTQTAFISPSSAHLDKAM